MNEPIIEPIIEPDWITKLRKELMFSKMTHSFTFSRDETMELLDMHWRSAAKTAELQAELAQVSRYCEVLTDQHIADTAIEAERDSLQAENKTLKARVAGWEQKAQNWLASPEAAQRLEGYRELAQRLNHAEAECERLRANIEPAARYGWEHPKWEWSAVKGGLDRFTDAAMSGKEKK